MPQRFISLWFPHLTTDWFALRQPELQKEAFVLTAPEHGRIIIKAVNATAQAKGIGISMALADARAIVPSIQVFEDQPELPARLLKALGQWCIRYTPIASVDLPGGLLLDVTGCAHLWGSEQTYLQDIVTRLKERGYHIRAAMADTIGAAWALSRLGKNGSIVISGGQAEAILPLPVAGLRLDMETLDRLQKLGLHQICNLASLQKSALRRRFGKELLLRLDQALGFEEEVIEPIVPIVPFQERLPCLEPIATATGIEIALQRLLQAICMRLKQEGKGLREAMISCYRVDGKIVQAEISTNKPSNNAAHLFKLFELKVPLIEPALGIELFLLEARKVEDATPLQETLWRGNGGLQDIGVAELLDRITGKMGADSINRYLPDEHYWPERSVKKTSDINEKPATAWRVDKPRPILLLPKPERVEVTAPVPDYPPMLFRYKGKLHKIKKSDGPERIEREWWLETGEHRDYYHVEDEEGGRYWIFRLGHYSAEKPHSWFLHGFF